MAWINIKKSNSIVVWETQTWVGGFRETYHQNLKTSLFKKDTFSQAMATGLPWEQITAAGPSDLWLPLGQPGTKGQQERGWIQSLRRSGHQLLLQILAPGHKMLHALVKKNFSSCIQYLGYLHLWTKSGGGGGIVVGINWAFKKTPSPKLAQFTETQLIFALPEPCTPTLIKRKGFLGLNINQTLQSFSKSVVPIPHSPKGNGLLENTVWE